MTDRRLRLALAAVAVLAVAASLAATPARALEGIIWSGSVFVDQWGFLEKSKTARKSTSPGFAPMTSLKVGADVNDNLSVSAKACIGCHGIEMEHVALDYQPKPWFNVQAGRILVPFGDFSSRADPSSYRTGSQPLIYDMGRMAFGGRTAMNLGVISVPYVDTGVLVYGVKWLGSRVQAWYGANDVDWMAMRSTPYNDNNDEPAYGGRGTLSYSSDAGDLIGDASVGGSYTAGKYDRDKHLKYEAWAADATFRLSKLVLRGEYAHRKTDLDPNASGYPYALVDKYFTKEGFYVEAEHPLGKYLTLVYRYEELKRKGTPLPGAPAEMTANSRFTRYTGGVVLTPAANVFVKASWEYWDTSDFGSFNTYHAGIGGAF
jgi:cytochrome c553